MNTNVTNPQVPFSVEKGFGPPIIDAPAEEPKVTPTRTALPKFLTMRSGSQQPERILNMANIDEVKATVGRQIKAGSGATKYIAVYQLMFVEVYEPSSTTLTPEQFDESLDKQARIEAEVNREGV